MSYKATHSAMQDYASNTCNAKNNGTRNCTNQVIIPNCIKPGGNMRDYASNTLTVKHDTFKLHVATRIHNEKCIHSIQAHIAISPPLQSVENATSLLTFKMIPAQNQAEAQTIKLERQWQRQNVNHFK